MGDKDTVPAIVVAAYSRPLSLSRLFSMLLAAKYPAHVRVPLIISIDGGGDGEVVRIANEFDWPYGEKEVIAHSKNLGLREHILSCGDLTERYGAIVMLEDDLGVSKFYYEYTLQALKHFSGDVNIAGLSLYKHLINVNCGSRYDPLDNGLGYFYMQFAQSWGQIWTHDQWAGFRNWYHVESNRTKELDIPEFVENWPESSWLKHYTRYLVDEKKYFVYPMRSLSTNFSDSGTHVSRQDNSYQVPLAEYSPILRPAAGESAVAYDAYFEITPKSFFALTDGRLGDGLVIDLYGVRNLSSYHDEQLVLTVRECHEYEKSNSFRLKPREMNVLLDLPGEGIFLAKCGQVKVISEVEAIAREFDYDKKWLGMSNMIRLIVLTITRRLFGRL